MAGSFIFLVVAIWKPHYDVVGRGSLPPSTASLLSALIAKLIEMAFATVVVATIGQALSRRAVTERSTGISVSDMSMRVWVMMPGSLMAQARNVRYSAWTSVGIIAILSAICASLYTTASDALGRARDPEHSVCAANTHISKPKTDLVFKRTACARGFELLQVREPGLHEGYMHHAVPLQ